MPRVAQSDIDDRRRAMTVLLRDRSYLPVAELCRRFKISQATARRDLAALSKSRAIVRTFGGAMADFDRRFAPFADRLKLAAPAKARIAARAYSLLQPGMTVFLDAGTTLFALATLLRRRPIPLQIVTNSLAVAEHLANVKDITIDLLGGRLLANQSVLLGPKTLQAAEHYELDFALLSAEGMNDAGVWNSTPDVVSLQRAVINATKRHALCLDSRKLNQRAPTFLLPWHAADLLITDATPAALQSANVDLKPNQILSTTDSSGGAHAGS